ncbi:DUF6143 family protein [Clostridium sp.]|uniref:DUF6143 family protein n=1 Tax=Clostridium sp. TaxID=1506 RepID=UPI00359F9707
MLMENNNYIIDRKNIPQEVVSIPVSLSKSMQRKYFVGQTEGLWVGSKSNAWAGLVNPHNSGVDLYANVFTISNFSDNYLTAEIWLNSSFPEKGNVSKRVSPSNTASRLPSKNEVNIRFIKSSTKVPENGVNVYKRIVPPKATLVAEEDGKFIESPGGSYVIIIKSSTSKLSDIIVAFGWWEKSRC